MADEIFTHGINYLDRLQFGFVSRLLLAFFIFLIGFIFGKTLGKLVYKILNEIELNKIIRNTSGMRLNLERFISVFLSYIIYIISLIAALAQLGVVNIVFYFFAATIFILIIISFFLMLKDFLPNLVTGIFVERKLLKKGRSIKINNITGKIVKINLTNIHLKNKENELIIIPNTILIKSQINLKKIK
ncbi:mechanosensitive ion channel [Candidatus Woesearchaeota archaeon]|nr:mechanosensitive ion channel [Candidatus Woesearchaeota archaeon]